MPLHVQPQPWQPTDPDEPLWDRRRLAAFLGYSLRYLYIAANMADLYAKKMPRPICGADRSERWSPEQLRLWRAGLDPIAPPAHGPRGRFISTSDLPPKAQQRLQERRAERSGQIAAGKR